MIVESDAHVVVVVAAAAAAVDVEKEMPVT